AGAVGSSTASGVGIGISATSESSNGFFTSKVPSPVRHSPFTRYGRTVIVRSPPSRVGSSLSRDGRPVAGPRAPLGTRSRSVERHHDVLDVRVVLERVDAHVLAVAGLLVSTVRHLGRERDV